jgi:quinol monooxygenase YgiN
MAFVRVGLFKAKTGSADDLCRTYSTLAIPAIRAAKGNVSALLLRPHEAENDFLAITIWSSRDDAELYDQRVRRGKWSTRFGTCLPRRPGS